MSKTLCGVAALALLGSCSPKRSGPGADDDGSGTGSGSDNQFGSACASEMVTAQSVPLDIYVMLDQSLSMADASKWTSVTTALASFVSQPNLDGMSVGLGYFAVPGVLGDSCNASDYATPSVEIAPLARRGRRDHELDGDARPVDGHADRAGTRGRDPARAELGGDACRRRGRRRARDRRRA
jgi:hypothetical protein